VHSARITTLSAFVAIFSIEKFASKTAFFSTLLVGDEDTSSCATE
jgi:hypothetical protein